MIQKNNTKDIPPAIKKDFNIGTFIFLIILIGANIYFSSIMGIGPFFKTLLNTAFSVLTDTVLYICAICVLMGALSALLSEFKVVSLFQWLLSPIMKPIWGMPGASAIGVVTSFLSDNPAALALYESPQTRPYFKKYQTAALANLGTSFGMGMICVSFMLGLGSEYVPAIGIGLLATVIGSIISTRLMIFFSKSYYKKKNLWEEMNTYEEVSDLQVSEVTTEQENIKKSVFTRVLDAILDGGKLGWEICFQTTPGVVCICTLVMLLTFGPGTASNGAAAYTGAAYEGIALLPKIGNLIAPVTHILFGFTDGSSISYPITALGAVGAANSLVPQMIKQGLAHANEVAVFTALGITWSGFLSTHVSMLDTLHKRDLTAIAMGTHFIGGLAAGIIAHYLFILIC